MPQHSRKRKILESEDQGGVHIEGGECRTNRQIIYEHIFSTPPNFIPRCSVATNTKGNLRKHFAYLLQHGDNGEKRVRKKEWYSNLFKVCLYNENNAIDINRVKESREQGFYTNNMDEVLEKVQLMVERKFDCENLFYQHIIVHASLLFDYFFNKKHGSGNIKKSLKEQIKQETLNEKMNLEESKQTKESKKRPLTKSTVSTYNEGEGDEEIKNARHIDSNKQYYILELKSLLTSEKNKFKNLEIFYHITNFILHKYWNSREYSNYNVFVWFLNYIKVKLDIKKAIHKVNEHLEMFINLHPKIFNISHAKKKRKKSGYRTPTTQYYENGVLDYPFVKNRCRQTGGGYPDITEIKNKNKQNTNTNTSATAGNFNQVGIFGDFQNNSNRSIFGNTLTTSNMKNNPLGTGTNTFNNTFKPFNQGNNSIFGMKGADNVGTNADGSTMDGTNTGSFFKNATAMTKTNAFANSINNATSIGNNANPLTNISAQPLGNFNFNNKTGILTNDSVNNTTSNLQANKGSSLFMNMNQSNNTMNTFGMNVNKNNTFSLPNNSANTSGSIFGNNASSTTDNIMNMGNTLGGVPSNPNQNSTINAPKVNSLFGSTIVANANAPASNNLFGFNSTSGGNTFFGNTNTSTMGTSTGSTSGLGSGPGTGPSTIFGNTNSSSTNLFGATKTNDNIFSKPSTTSGSIFGNPAGGSTQSPFSKTVNSINNNNTAPGMQMGSNNNNIMNNNTNNNNFSGMSSQNPTTTNNTSTVQNSSMINLFTNNNPKELFKDLKLNNDSGTKFSVVKKPLFSRSTKNSLFSSNTLRQENNLFNAPFMNKETSLLNNSEKPTKVIFGKHNNLPNETETNIFTPPPNNPLSTDSANKTIFGQSNNMGSNTGSAIFGASSSNTASTIATFGSTNIFGNTTDANRKNVGGNASNTLVIPTKKLTLEERKKKTMKHSNIVSLFSNNVNATTNITTGLGGSTTSVNPLMDRIKDANVPAASTTGSLSEKPSGGLLFGNNTTNRSLLNLNSNETKSTQIFGFNKDNKFELNSTLTASGNDSQIIFGIGGTQKSMQNTDKTKDNNMESKGEANAADASQIRKKFHFGASHEVQEKTENQKENTNEKEQTIEKEREKGQEQDQKQERETEIKNEIEVSRTNKRKKETETEAEVDQGEKKTHISNQDEENIEQGKKQAEEKEQQKKSEQLSDEKTDKESENQKENKTSGLWGFSQESKETQDKNNYQGDTSKQNTFVFTGFGSFSKSTNVEKDGKDEDKDKDEKEKEKKSLFDTNQENKKGGSLFSINKKNEEAEKNTSSIFTLNTQNETKEGFVFGFNKEENKSKNTYLNVRSTENEVSKMNENMNYDIIKNRERRRMQNMEKNTDKEDDGIHETGGQQQELSRKRKHMLTETSDLNQFNKGEHIQKESETIINSKVQNNLLDVKQYLNVLSEQPNSDNKKQMQEKDTYAEVNNKNLLFTDQNTMFKEKDIPNQSFHLNEETIQGKFAFEHTGGVKQNNNTNSIFGDAKNVEGEEASKQFKRSKGEESVNGGTPTETKGEIQHPLWECINTFETKKLDIANSDNIFNNNLKYRHQHDSTNERKRRRDEPGNIDQRNEEITENIKGTKQIYDHMMEQKKINKLVEYKQNIAFDNIDVDLDTDMLDAKDLRQKLFLCVLNFHFVFWGEKVMLFYPNNERINKFCKKLMKRKNEFDETYNFALFDQIQTSAQKLLKSLNNNSCIYDSVLFLAGESMHVLKNAKLSLFDAFNIYHFWFQKNRGNVKQNLQNFFYTNKIYPYYLSFHMNLYKNYTAYTYKNADLKRELSKKTKRKRVTNNKKRRHNGNGGLQGNVNPLESYAYKNQYTTNYEHSERKQRESSRFMKNDQHNFLQKYDKNIEGKESMKRTKEEEEDENENEYEDEEDDEDDDEDDDEEDEEEEDDEEDEETETDEESENSEENALYHQIYHDEKHSKSQRHNDDDDDEKEESEENKHATKVTDNFEEMFNSDSSEDSDTLDNNRQYVNLNIHVKQKYLYSVGTYKKKKKFELPSYIKIKKLSACECILLELILKNNVLNVLKKYKFFKTEKYEFLYTSVISMLKYYNYFELESNMDANDKAHEAFEKFEDTNGKNEKKIGWENEDPINSKSEKIALLRKLCDKNLLYYLNLQLKNIFHLMDYNEIELGCVYLNHIKNNLYVMFQLPILLLNVLYEKVVKSFNDYIILDTFFNNSKLFTEFRYEYIFKTKLAYIFCKRFYAMNDIENALKFAQYFDFFRIKVQKKSIYNDYIFHKNLINAYIKMHPSIVPKEWIMLQKENGEANDTRLNNTKEYLEYYTFFFNDISRYIKFNVVEQIINCNIFTLCRDEEALHKEREGVLCQKEREMKKQSLMMGVGVDMGMRLDTGMDMQLQMKMQMQKQKEVLTDGGEKQFMSYFRYMVRKSLLDDVVNLYACRGEYFYKRIVSLLANKEMKVKVDSSVNPYFYLFQQMAFVNHVMQSSIFAQLSIIKKRELYYVHREDQASHSLEQLKEECLKHMNMVSYVIQTVLAIVTKLEKNCPKDINIYLIINLRNIIIDIFYLFKYVLTEKEYSIDVLNVLYRNVTRFNDIIYSANPDDTYIFPMEQIRDLFSAVKEKYMRQNVI